MADRNISSQRDGDESSSVEHVDPPYVPHLRFSASDTPTLGGYESERRACNLDLSNSPSLRPGSAARDSGYNTDVSPAATISPATNTPRQQHFVFENLSHSQTTELEDRLSTQPHQPSYHFQFEQRPKSTPPLRLSPDIFKVSASPGRTVCPGTRTSSRPVSEASDTNRVQFDFESDEEEDSNNRRDNIGSRFSAPRVRSGEQFDLSESFLGVHLPDLSHDSDEDDDEDVFYKSDDILKNWGISSEPQTPRCRKSSLSLRQRRYCSTDEDDSQLGACGGHDPRGDTLSLGTNPAHDRRSNTLSASFGGYEGDLRSCVRNGSRAEERRSVRGSILNRHCESSLICSQHFQPSHSDHDSRENGSENAFTFDCDDIDDDEKEKVAQQVHHRDNHTVSIFRQGLPQSPVFRTRWRRISVTAHLRLSTGCLLPWSGAIHRVSVSTQTPHITSLMIQQILDTPCPLPNEARGKLFCLCCHRFLSADNSLHLYCSLNKSVC